MINFQKFKFNHNLLQKEKHIKRIDKQFIYFKSNTKKIIILMNNFNFINKEFYKNI